MSTQVLDDKEQNEKLSTQKLSLRTRISYEEKHS